MDNQVSASVETVYEDGRALMITRYMGLCGCFWKVDMWGNVHRVEVCENCMLRSEDAQYYLSLQSAGDE